MQLNMLDIENKAKIELSFENFLTGKIKEDILFSLLLSYFNFKYDDEKIQYEYSYFLRYKSVYFILKLFEVLDKKNKNYIFAKEDVFSTLNNFFKVISKDKVTAVENEEFILKLLEVMTYFKKDDLFVERQYLYNQNPYIVRAYLFYLADRKTQEDFSELMKFLLKNNRSLIKREIIIDVVNIFLENDYFAELFLEYLNTDRELRGYFRGMDMKAKEVNRYSYFPAHDYLKKRVELKGYDYDVFKYNVRGLMGKKI